MSLSIASTSPTTPTAFFLAVKDLDTGGVVQYVVKHADQIRPLFPADRVIKVRKKHAGKTEEKTDEFVRSTQLTRSLILFWTYEGRPALFETGPPKNEQIQDQLPQWERRSCPGLGLKFLGEGAAKMVYTAKELCTQQVVAFSISIESMQHEYEITHKIDSPYVHKITATGEYTREKKLPFYFAFSPVIQGCLFPVIRSADPAFNERAKQALGQLAMAICDIHRKNLWHNDLLPGNVLITPKSILLIDFANATQERDPSCLCPDWDLFCKRFLCPYIQARYTCPYADEIENDMRRKAGSLSDSEFLDHLFKTLPEIAPSSE